MRVAGFVCIERDSSVGTAGVGISGENGGPAAGSRLCQGPGLKGSAWRWPQEHHNCACEEDMMPQGKKGISGITVQDPHDQMGKLRGQLNDRPKVTQLFSSWDSNVLAPNSVCDWTAHK